MTSDPTEATEDTGVIVMTDEEFAETRALAAKFVRPSGPPITCDCHNDDNNQLLPFEEE